MPKKRTTVNGLHGERLKKIRRFVDFDYDLRKPLTKSQRAKVRRYYEEISALTNRPYQVFKSRNKKNLRDAQIYANNGRNLPGLTVAFIPTDGKNRVKLTFRKKGVIAKTKHVTATVIYLDTDELLVDPVAHVNDLIKNHPAEQFTVRADVYEIPSPYMRSTIGDAVARYVNRYGEANGLTPDDNHYYAHWLHGLNAYTFQDQGDLNEYLLEKQRGIKAGKRKREAERKRRQRQRERR